MSSYLDRINSPADLRALPAEAMEDLAAEIRRFLIRQVGLHGGHLASNLGVVELTLAMHRVFDCPTDHFIFDVGHQAYVHKIITGRRDRFDTLRTPGGLSGFTSRRESECDAFGAGHSSTSVSAALGFAEGDRLAGKKCHTVCLIGDGAYTGGMVHEALNNCRPDLPLVIILNENQMSISRNKGTFASYLAGVRSSQKYRHFKDSTKGALGKIPLIGKGLSRLLHWIKEGLVGLVYRKNYFEDLGLYYLGPIDGNDCAEVERALVRAKELNKTVIVHVKTCKGRGLECAERSPEKYHAVHPSVTAGDTFHSVCAREFCDLAASDERIVAITAAMGMGTGMDAFGASFPDRYFDVGIAEEHALTFAAGLAADGMLPYCAIYSTFLQRSYDNLCHDVALQGLDVHLFIDRAGLASADGATHHGIFDVAFLSHIPGGSVYAPASFGSLRAILRDSKEEHGTVAVRYPNERENEEIVRTFYPDADYENYGVRADYARTPDVVFVSYGSVTAQCLAAEKILRTEGIGAGTVLLEKLKPYAPTAQKLLPLIRGAKTCVFVEEGIKNGGAAMILKELLCDAEGAPKMKIAAIDDSFVIPERACGLLSFAGLDAESLVALAKSN